MRHSSRPLRDLCLVSLLGHLRWCPTHCPVTLTEIQSFKLPSLEKCPPSERVHLSSLLWRLLRAAPNVHHPSLSPGAVEDTPVCAPRASHAHQLPGGPRRAASLAGGVAPASPARQSPAVITTSVLSDAALTVGFLAARAATALRSPSVFSIASSTEHCSHHS